MMAVVALIFLWGNPFLVLDEAVYMNGSEQMTLPGSARLL